MAIELINVKKQYNGKTVVDDFSVKIPKGKITSFIGPNGAGKSTVLSMISRLIQVDHGDVLLEGQSLATKKSRDIAQQLSVLKQSNHIDLRLSVEDLVAFGRFPYSQGRLTQEDQQFIEKAIAYMGLQDFKDRYINELSGGQRQRAYIAMTLAQDTDYVLLDEPLNNLDMKHSVQIMQVLRKLVDELHKTVVIVIHDINFASCYSDHIVAMRDGRLVYQGAIEEIMQTDVLQDIYGMQIPIHDINGNSIAVYFKN